MIQHFHDMTVELIHATPYPAEVTAQAISITMSTDPENIPPVLTSKKCMFLLDAEHTSVFEHVNFTFLVQGVSRALHAQVHEHRIASHTSGSQHYQTYSAYPGSVPVGFPDIGITSILDSKEVYEDLLNMGVPKANARQVLPMAMAVNFMWTINARSLMGFLRQRLCKRNVDEMLIFSNRVLKISALHFPELFNNAGPQCFMDGTCKQGKFSCGKPWK
ncbi:MAG: FAD-dependent thymidylate synthase [Proteobacteria bacterium]|nr:FAD-dependent thymidylate synthase [Pseudomonadota bacterium]